MYEQQHAVLLATPHACAFLLHGGIAWHLAQDLLNLDDILNGLLSPLDIFQHDYYMQCDGEYWSDNDISVVELDLLLGLYICHTGMQIAQVTIEAC